MGCAKKSHIIIPYPPMEAVVLNDDGSMNPDNVDKTVKNMLALSEWADLLYIR